LLGGAGEKGRIRGEGKSIKIDRSSRDQIEVGRDLTPIQKRTREGGRSKKPKRDGRQTSKASWGSPTGFLMRFTQTRGEGRNGERKANGMVSQDRRERTPKCNLTSSKALSKEWTLREDRADGWGRATSFLRTGKRLSTVNGCRLLD